MKEIRIPLEQFDLEGFLDRTVEFLRGWWSTELDPTFGIISVQGLGEDPVFVHIKWPVGAQWLVGRTLRVDMMAPFLINGQ